MILMAVPGCETYNQLDYLFKVHCRQDIVVRKAALFSLNADLMEHDIEVMGVRCPGDIVFEDPNSKHTRGN